MQRDGSRSNERRGNICSTDELWPNIASQLPGAAEGLTDPRFRVVKKRQK